MTPTERIGTFNHTMVTIRIPTPLRTFCAGLDEARVPGTTVGEAVKELIQLYPQVSHAVLAEGGEVRGYVNVFVNREDIRHLERLDTPVQDGDTIHILPSIAGG